MVTILSSASGDLVLEPDENEWCQVVLDIGGHRRALGADLTSIIVERLLRALLDKPVGLAVGVLEGVDVRWVLSLAERHSTLYMSDQSGRRIVFIQAGDGSTMAKLSLDADDVARWRDQLGDVSP